MTYLVIDTDGELHQHDRAPTLNMITDVVGPEGWAHVWLNPAWGMHGWVNDCGLIMPERYPRNVLGSCTLGMLGAGQQPFAGPVVITGYNHASDWGGPEPLTQQQLGAVVDIHNDMVRALAGEDLGLCHCGCGKNRGNELRAFADMVRTSDVPPITILSDGDALRFLGGG